MNQQKELNDTSKLIVNAAMKVHSALGSGLLNSCSKYQSTLGITVRPEPVEGQAD